MLLTPVVDYKTFDTRNLWLQQNKLYVIDLMHAATQCVQNALAYFAPAESYGCKMFMKLTPGPML
jgi:hypothetical protein